MKHHYWLQVFMEAFSFFVISFKIDANTTGAILCFLVYCLRFRFKFTSFFFQFYILILNIFFF